VSGIARTHVGALLVRVLGLHVATLTAAAVPPSPWSVVLLSLPGVAGDRGHHRQASRILTTGTLAFDRE
jgi:hypothetical protein